MSEEIDQSKVPPVHVCEALVKEFVEITETNQALAQFYLQDTAWELTPALNTFYTKSQQGGEPVVEVRNKPKAEFKFLSWNIDGLSEKNLKIRCKSICKIIEDEKIEIVFLQEVIPETLKYLRDKLPKYLFIEGGDENYFCVVLLRRYTIYPDSFEVVPYRETRMGRNLIVVEAHIGEAKLVLMNTHLESTKEHSETRLSQLRECFRLIHERNESEETVIFGGDLNLRDAELEKIGGLPPGVEDLWIVNGSRKEAKYTWDMTRNTNLEFSGRYKPRYRFDRTYIRHRSPRQIIPEYFGLLGIQKVNNTQSFPSDHWGLINFFKISDYC